MESLEISVETAPGLLPNEQCACLRSDGRTHCILLRREQISPQGTIQAQIVNETADKILVELPGETLGFGRRVWIDRSSQLYLRSSRRYLRLVK